MFDQQRNLFKMLTYENRCNFEKNEKIELFYIKIVLNHNAAELFEKNFKKNRC